MSDGDEESTDDRPSADEAAAESGSSRGVAAAPTRRPSSMRSKSLSTMPTSDGETHQLYLEIASLQMAKARQERIRDSLQQQVDEARRQIANARDRTDELLDRARQREKRSGAEAGRPDGADDADDADEPDTFEY